MLLFSDHMKTIEKDENMEPEVNHNFEADMYLEKLDQENEKVCSLILFLYIHSNSNSNSNS